MRGQWWWQGAQRSSPWLLGLSRSRSIALYLPALTDWCTYLLGAWGLNILSGESWPQKEARGHVRSRGKEMAQSGLSSPVLLWCPSLFSVSADALIGRKAKVFLLPVLTPWGPLEYTKVVGRSCSVRGLQCNASLLEVEDSMLWEMWRDETRTGQNMSFKVRETWL